MKTNQIKVMLAIAGITQTELAKKMETSQSNVSDKINRFPKCSFDFILEVAKICNCDIKFEQKQ